MNERFVSGLLARFTARTEQSRARAAKHAFRDLFALAPIPIVILRGHELILELANEAALNVIGNRDAVGRPLLELLPEMQGQGCARVLREVLETGVPHVREETFIGLDERRPLFQGTSYWTFTCARWAHSAGEEHKVIVVFADVTAQVIARKNIEALAAKADAANRAKDQFFAMLSHELRNPLSPILTALEVLRLRGMNTEEQAVMERQVRHLVRLVDDLLDISRITRGKVDLERRPMRLHEIVAAAVELAGGAIAERRQVLTVNVPHDLGVDVDFERMTQVVANLLANAARYSPDGAPITVTATAVHDRVHLTVADQGIGIDPTMLDKVFEPFARYAGERNRPATGLGLGLTIVSNLVQLHGGRVMARSAGIGKGSEFVVELPRSELAAEPQALAPREAASSPTAARPRVIVVDDNVDAAKTLASALESVGYDTRVAHDGPSALAVAAEFGPEAALVDIGLPVMSGYEVAQRLHEQRRDMRLIAITGYGQPDDVRRSAEAGFEHHFVKPVALDAVRTALRQ